MSLFVSNTHREELKIDHELMSDIETLLAHNVCAVYGECPLSRKMLFNLPEQYQMMEQWEQFPLQSRWMYYLLQAELCHLILFYSTFSPLCS